MNLDAMSQRIAAREGVVAAAPSWKWPLLDRGKRPIEADAEVKWIANSLVRLGRVIGSPQEGQVEVEESKTGRRLQIAAARLTVLDAAAEDEAEIVLPKTHHSSQPEPDTVPDPPRTESVLVSAIQEGDVLLASVGAHRVLHIVAETNGGRTFVREDVDTGALSLAVMASAVPVTRYCSG